MKKLFATIAVALALAAVPSASLARNGPTAAIGVAFHFPNNRATVAEVMPGGPGHLMGIRPGDVVTHAGGRRITSQARLAAYIRSLTVGGPVELTVRRGGESLRLTGTAMARRW